MRIAINLLWCVPGVGGSEEYLVRQLMGTHAHQHSHQVEVFAPKGFSARQPELAQHFIVHEAPSSCEKRAIRIFLEHTWLAARTAGFDLVHHGGGTIPRIGNRRTVLTIHDVQWTQYPHYVRPIKLRYLRRVVPSSVKRATRIVVPSHFVATTLRSEFSTDASRIGVVRHGVEAELSDDATPEHELRERFGIGDGPVLVFPAITHPHKNHQFLLHQMAEGSEEWRDPSLRLVCAGSAGSHDSTVRAVVDQLGLGHRVVLPGRVSARDRNGLLKMADAMVFPSQYEGFGAPLIEAMILGAPVLASTCGSIPEVVGDAGVTAELTISAWNEGLRTLRARRAELVRAGQQRVSHFSLAESGADLLHEYAIAISEGQ